MNVSTHYVSSNETYYFEVRLNDDVIGTLVGKGYGFKTPNQAFTAGATFRRYYIKQ